MWVTTIWEYRYSEVRKCREICHRVDLLNPSGDVFVTVVID